MIRSVLRHLWLPLVLLAGASAAAEMDFQITSDRGDTYRAAVTIDNPGDRKVTGWTLEFTLDRDVVQTFGAQMTRIAADRYRFTPSEWTREIAPGGQAKFTFVGKPGNLKSGPQQVKLDVSFAEAGAAVAAPAPTPAPAPVQQAAPAPKQAWTERPAGERVASAGRPTSGSGVPHLVAFKLNGSWHNGFTAQVAVVNNTDRMIRPWRLEFDLDSPIEEIWDAQVRQIGEGRYVVTPRDYNQELPPGGFIVFGFKGGSAFKARPSDTRLAEGG